MNDLEVYRRHAAAVAGVDVGEFVEPRHGRCRNGPISLHYLDWGGSAARSVLFLHGGCLTAHTWDLVCLALRDRYRCIAVDLRGHGESSWATDGDYSVGANAGDAECLVACLGLVSPVIVGMSLGGLTGLEYAARRGDDLRGLVVIDVGPAVRVDSPEGQRMRDFIQAGLAVASIDEALARVIEYRPDRRPELLRYSLLHNLRQHSDGLWRWKYDPALPRSADPQRLAEEFHGLWERVKTIRSPTLVVRGAHSELFTREDADELVRHLPDGRWVEVPGAGHTVQGENPAGLLRHLEPFLAGLWPGTGADASRATSER